MNITVLCKVVDNFGDIGVVWRLCRKIINDQLSMTNDGEIINDQLSMTNNRGALRLIVDDLGAFNKIDDRVKVDCAFQVVEGIEIYDWNDGEYCHPVFAENDGEKLEIILECFQCGRPDWMEKILFDEKLERTVHIIMIDYLTAEKYAEDFHCLESLTRSKRVQKVNFMPGFTEKTGGLIIDDEWKTLPEYDGEGPVLVFTYEREWGALARGIAAANINAGKVLVAQGRGKDSFVQAWNQNNVNQNDNVNKNGNVILNSFQNLHELPYLNQPDWDKMMKTCSVLFIRGEESMSRACLSGIPFVWHAYPQSDEYQLVKVNALLERMERHFDSEDFEIIRAVWLDFNSPESDMDEEKFQSDVTNFINNKEKLRPGFNSFAQSLLNNGDLTTHLLNYIKNLS